MQKNRKVLKATIDYPQDVWNELLHWRKSNNIFDIYEYDKDLEDYYTEELINEGCKLNEDKFYKYLGQFICDNYTSEQNIVKIKFIDADMDSLTVELSADLEECLQKALDERIDNSWEEHHFDSIQNFLYCLHIMEVEEIDFEEMLNYFVEENPIDNFKIKIGKE